MLSPAKSWVPERDCIRLRSVGILNIRGMRDLRKGRPPREANFMFI
jgi:hypothetical protein